ncbi:MAG: SprT family zinc-dependent metalloprotease [Desulfuromonadaceae bacterium]|nr:SprT family zinc-dependent metalloprotease [Desulfuromonadaceae bacterium]
MATALLLKSSALAAVNRRTYVRKKVLYLLLCTTSTSIEKIDQFLLSKRLWINEKMTLQRDMAPASNKQFVSGEAYPYLGRDYRLKVEHGPFAPVKLLQGRLVVQMPESGQQPCMIGNSIVRWYKRQAEQKIREKIKRYAPIVGVEPAGVNIKTFKSRWGSCTAKGELEFNWLIMLAPNRMVDYVVIHKLCHLIHHDHSSEFWWEVGRVMPDYQVCREWLLENSEGLLA